MLTRSALDPNITEEDAFRMQLEILYSLYMTVDKLEQIIGAERAKQIHKEVHELIEQRYKLLMDNAALLKKVD